MGRHLFLVMSLLMAGLLGLAAQEKSPEAKPAVRPGAEYSGMYSFLKEGEFVQVTVEDEGRVTGFVSRYGQLDSDKGAFLDQFFKTGKLDGIALTFTTEVVHGTAYEFKGTIVRGEGKKPGDEGYYQIKGTLIERVTDVNQKTSSRSSEVTFKAFPAEPS
ncbi:MAG TPA: hypothetical protein VLL05_17960 [Terriglobales bacterium]|nr:hypothetical protein [Terriglobales bacterium]